MVARLDLHTPLARGSWDQAHYRRRSRLTRRPSANSHHPHPDPSGSGRSLLCEQLATSADLKGIPWHFDQPATLVLVVGVLSGPHRMAAALLRRGRHLPRHLLRRLLRPAASLSPQQHSPARTSALSPARSAARAMATGPSLLMATPRNSLPLQAVACLSGVTSNGSFNRQPDRRLRL